MFLVCIKQSIINNNQQTKNKQIHIPIVKPKNLKAIVSLINQLASLMPSPWFVRHLLQCFVLKYTYQ